MTNTPETLKAADGTPLEKKLEQSLFRSRLRAFGLVSPLLVFLIFLFVLPIFMLLFQGVYDPRFTKLMPETSSILKTWDGVSEPTEQMYESLVSDLIVAKKNKTIGKVGTRVNRELSGTRSLFTSSARKAEKLEPPFKVSLVKFKKKWGNIETWQAMKVSSNLFTIGFIASSLDYKLNADGSLSLKDKERRIHIKLFLRTLEISLIVTIATLLLILVLLPFWTSLLVRTTAWIAMLQGQGVMNDMFVIFGFAENDDRFSLIYNKTGVLIAMTHILLPFMILPIYSVMKTISPSYVRAAKSLGATNYTAFWRVYVPQTIPGVGAGALLVFILAIGYYITPALVGGQDGQMISNFIDFHMRKSLNWNLAAAMGIVLLVIILFLFWLYDRLVGIDKMKLG